jgi:DNA-directed RNA polymerase specialized sigma54-like protein
VTDDEADDDDVSTQPSLPTKLNQQLVMTPQLQLAIRLLGTPTRDLPALIAEWQRDHPGAVEELVPGEADPYDERELELASEEEIEPWFYFEEEPFPPLGADVWVFGNPPRARANGRALPRLKAVFDDRMMTRSAADIRQATWLVRGLRQRARTFERITGAIVAARPQLATAPDPASLAPVKVREVAEAVGMHESTIRRVVAVCRFQTLHGVVVFAVAGDAIGFRCE